MKSSKRFSVQIGFCGVLLIILIRVAIGWHFFYEGIHKFDPYDKFSSKGFLGQAKGPTAPFFYAMLPDLNGTKRLEIQEIEVVRTDAAGKERKTMAKTFTAYENAWKEYYGEFRKKYADKIDAEIQEKLDEVYNRYCDSLHAGATSVEADVKAHLESWKRFDETLKTQKNDAPFEQQRRWDSMMAYRREAEGWTNMLDGLGNALQSDLSSVISPQLAGEKGNIVTGPEKVIIPNPFIKTQMKLLDFAVSVGLTAIGFCMMVGFCNRLACLGGAAFLVNVLLTTWPVPGVYPPLPSAVGNFLFFSKDAVELLGCLFLAVIPAGRWGGLDFFLWNCGGKQICRLFGFGQSPCGQCDCDETPA